MKQEPVSNACGLFCLPSEAGEPCRCLSAITVLGSPYSIVAKSDRPNTCFLINTAECNQLSVGCREYHGALSAELPRQCRLPSSCHTEA